MVQPKSAEQFLKDLVATAEKPGGLFEDLHKRVRAAMADCAKDNGYALDFEEFEKLLWERGLGHEQIELYSNSWQRASRRIEERFEKEGHKRGTDEERLIKDLVIANVGDWRHKNDEYVDEHTAFLVIHSAAV